MIQTILIPTDFSDCSTRALRLGLDIAERFGAKAIVLHASADIDRSAFLDKKVLDMVTDVLDDEAQRLKESAEKQMQALVAEGGSALDEGSIEYRVAAGAPHQVIVDVANDAEVDLVVMGTHGRTNLKEMMLGSTTDRVQRRASCAVLTVKPEGYPFLKD